MESWGLQTIQFVLFRDDVDGFKANSLFQTFAGDEADNIQNNRTITAATPFHSLASGTVDERYYQVTVQPGRVDFQVSCPDRPQSGPWAWKIKDGLLLLHKHLDKILSLQKLIGNTSRVAVPVTLLRNVGSQKEASNFIASHIGNEQFSDAIDLVFQLNRPVNSELKGVAINRLMRFTAATLQQITMQMQENGPKAIGQSSARYIASCLLDINTVPTGKNFSSLEAATLLNEMVEAASMMATDGTVAALVVQ